jgi:hypothetical protein
VYIAIDFEYINLKDKYQKGSAGEDLVDFLKNKCGE